MKTYLFDLDGTLLDSIGLILESFHHTARVHLGRDYPDAYWLAGIGTPLRDQLAAVAADDAERDAMLDTYRQYNLEHHDESARPYPGVVDVVRELDRRGANLALVTSKMSRGAVRGLRLLGLERELSVRVCADDVVNGKPHPEPVLKALRALGAPPTDAVIIGDSAHDLQSGARAGIATAAVAWGPFSRDALQAEAPTHWIEDPAAILTL